MTDRPRQSTEILQPRPLPVLWFTGLSGAGKSTLASEIHRRLHEQGILSSVLDGDAMRAGLCRDLGFSEADRAENIRRIGCIAQLFASAGTIPICATISPSIAMRQQLRDQFVKGQFIEIFVDAPLDVCESRDPKGLYLRARQGQVKKFTGIDSAYEPPANPELHLKTHLNSLQECVSAVFDYLWTLQGLIGAPHKKSVPSDLRRPG